MLPEREQRVLRQIEEQLRADDPRFASGFATGFTAAERRAHRWRGLFLVLLDVTVVLMITVGVFADRAWLVFCGLVGAGIVGQAHRMRTRVPRR